jgi:mRNA interferase RelE/StbE
MARHRIVFRPSAARAFAALPAAMQARISRRLVAMEDHPRPSGIKALAGAAAGAYRLRVGDYRVIYEVHDDQVVVLVLAIGHRREIYRQK